MDSAEIELKLGLAPEDMAELRRRPPLSSALDRAGAPRRLASIYFDTADFALAAAGLTVRVRRIGDRHVQTVKDAGSRCSGLFVRREWEAEVAGPHPDPQALRATGLAIFADGGLVDRLAPAFVSDIRRSCLHLAGPEAGDGPAWEIEASLDLGELVAGPASESICEVELELRRGRPDHLFSLARQVLDAVPARPLAASKSERGVRLAQGVTLRPVKARPPSLSPRLSTAEAFRTIARSCLDHLLINEACLIATADGEAVHQMRVALRRLRSAIRLFRPVIVSTRLDEVRDEVRWLLDRLGPARDADVLLDEIIAPVRAAHPADAGLVALEEMLRRDQGQRLTQAVDAVRHRRFAALVLDLGEWVEGGDWLTPAGRDLAERLAAPVRPFALKRLGKAVRRMLRQGGDDLTRLPPDELHQVRILGKQARYAGEFFADLVPRKQMKVYLGELAHLQQALGRLNDIAVAGARLADAPAEGGLARAAGLVAGWHQGQRRLLLEDAQQTWERLAARGLPWDED